MMHRTSTSISVLAALGMFCIGLAELRAAEPVTPLKVGFAEPRSDGDSNAKIATVLEYGKSGQPAKPFLKPAKSASRKACIDAMKAKLESEVNGI